MFNDCPAHIVCETGLLLPKVGVVRLYVSVAEVLTHAELERLALTRNVVVVPENQAV